LKIRYDKLNIIDAIILLKVVFVNKININFQELASLIMDLSTAELIYFIALPVFLILGVILLLYSCWLILREKDDNNKIMMFIISILIPIAGPIFSIYTLKKNFSKL
jgi:hypothetical protein